MLKNYFSELPIILVLILGILSTQPAFADEKSAQKWSGYVEYVLKHVTTDERDSEWVHAASKPKTKPTSHKKTTNSEALSASFVLSRGNPDISAKVIYTLTTKTEIESKAEVVCRRPNVNSYYTHLSRHYTENFNVAGSGQIARSQVFIAVNEETGKYRISVDSPGVAATGTLKKMSTEETGCGEPTPSAPESSPPITIESRRISAEATGRIDPSRPNVLAGSFSVSPFETLTWNLSSDPDDPPIAIHGPYDPVRGDEVTFDGSRSRGKNLRYEWTFKAGDCSEGSSAKEARKEGPVVNATLLCNTEVTLEVSDGDRKDKKRLTVEVKPRDWNTEIVRGSKLYFNDGTYMSSEFHTVHFFAGANRCAKHEDRNAGDHYLHPVRREWEGGVYNLKQVKDGGPFDGMFYVNLVTNPLQVPRVIWLNSDFLPSSRMAKENAKFKDTSRDFKTLVEEVEAHELMHTTLLEEAVRDHDFAKKIEFLVGKSQEDLNTKVMVELGEGESALQQAAVNEQEVKTRLKRNPQFNRGGMIRVPIGSLSGDTFGDWQIPNFANLGGD